MSHNPTGLNGKKEAFVFRAGCRSLSTPSGTRGNTVAYWTPSSSVAGEPSECAESGPASSSASSPANAVSRCREGSTASA
uniref:Uncharacterized protein n=1 Tax=Chromera velia CCMP2878 TaxID=1169474 RepID=A0A0G4I2Y6_9ALVE|eukprot:Cvel_10527.t1-p1 / transcript=Cvel_10527.t1 / gene=Cvel_10527 / organism=Chromera_velia_CCMP2878 / gene_product=hypothetical protein / transcript_product=hypothetical protein / location=Cvel_scaffold637:10181-15156(+) / protein_length=79 / sequence_SO=supercontig / SO=protein_coding / is_pseudo=false